MAVGDLQGGQGRGMGEGPGTGGGGMVAQYQGTSHGCEEVTFWARGGQCLRKKALWPGLRTCTPVSSAPGFPRLCTRPSFRKGRPLPSPLLEASSSSFKGHLKSLEHAMAPLVIARKPA